MIIKRTANLIVIGTAAIYHSRITIPKIQKQMDEIRKFMSYPDFPDNIRAAKDKLGDAHDDLSDLSDDIRAGRIDDRSEAIQGARDMALWFQRTIWILILYSITISILWLTD